MARQDSSRGGCFKWFAGGCGCVVLLGVIVISFVVFNIGWFKSTFEGVKDSFDEMMTVRAALQTEFDTPNVEIGYNLDTSNDRSSMTVTLVDPPLFDDPRVDLEARARDVAAFAKLQLEVPDSWSEIRVRLKRSSTSSSILSSTHDFAFRIDELPDRDEPAHGSPDESEGADARLLTGAAVTRHA